MMKHKHRVTYLCNSSALIQKQELANNKTYTFAEETANLLKIFDYKSQRRLFPGCCITIALCYWWFLRLNVFLFPFSCNAEEGKHRVDFVGHHLLKMTKRWQ